MSGPAVHIPEAVTLLRDFVNTVDREDGTEQLGDAGATATWFVDRGLLPPGTRLDDADHRRVLALREGLRRALQQHAHPDCADADGDQLAALNQALSGIPIRVQLDAAAGLRLAGVRGAGLAFGALFDAVHRSQVGGHWERLKVCAKDSCRWAYFDASRNRSGRWCSMSECGNRVKMRRAHAARRQRRSTVADGG